MKVIVDRLRMFVSEKGIPLSLVSVGRNIFIFYEEFIKRLGIYVYYQVKIISKFFSQSSCYFVCLAPRVLSPFHGAGYLNDPESYAGWSLYSW